jgi:hypothetical protein
MRLAGAFVLIPFDSSHARIARRTCSDGRIPSRCSMASSPSRKSSSSRNVETRRTAAMPFTVIHCITKRNRHGSALTGERATAEMLRFVGKAGAWDIFGTTVGLWEGPVGRSEQTRRAQVFWKKPRNACDLPEIRRRPQAVLRWLSDASMIDSGPPSVRNAPPPAKTTHWMVIGGIATELCVIVAESWISRGHLLSTVTRHFLMMAATPHNRKDEDFQLLMSLPDSTAIATGLPCHSGR